MASSSASTADEEAMAFLDVPGPNERVLQSAPDDATPPQGAHRRMARVLLCPVWDDMNPL